MKAVLFTGPEAKGPAGTPQPQTDQTHSSQSDKTGPDQQPGDETPREKPKPIENNNLESYLTEQCGEGASSNQETLDRSENLLQSSQTNETSQEPMQVDSRDIIVNQPENTSPESEGSVRSSSATDTASEMGNEMWSSGNSSTLVCTLAAVEPFLHPIQLILQQKIVVNGPFLIIFQHSFGNHKILL